MVFGVISVVASGIITRDGRMGFKWRKGNVATFSGDRGSNREKEVLRHFLESGVQMEKRRHEVFSGDGVHIGDRE